MKISQKMPHGTVIFCDDIRQEVGDKRSLMGVYDAEMIFSEGPPAVLTTFAMLVKWMWDLDQLAEPVKFVLYKDVGSESEELFNTNIEVPQVLPFEVSVNAADPDAPRIGQLAFVLKVGPFQIDGPCVLRMLAFVGSDEHRIGGLRMKFKVGQGAGE